jgi:2-iminobutanoate/2-iminopropanoate deaminase
MRKSVHIEGFKHANPIPNATRIGNIVMSGVILGRDPETEKPAPTLEAQCALVFRYIRETIEAAGGTCEDIIKVTVWLKNPGDREALNTEWIKMFPDPHSRPARHSQPGPADGPYFIQCDFMAVL